MFPRPCGGLHWAVQDGGTGPVFCLLSAFWEPLDILHCSAKPGVRHEGCCNNTVTITKLVAEAMVVLIQKGIQVLQLS